MLGMNEWLPVFAYRHPVDMRKGFEGLGGLVREQLGEDPLSGALFLFTNRRRTTAKVLHFDGTGMCMYQKRLERGRFVSLWDGPGDRSLRLSRAELELFLKGCQVIGKMRLLPSPLDEKVLAIGVR